MSSYCLRATGDQVSVGLGVDGAAWRMCGGKASMERMEEARF